VQVDVFDIDEIQKVFSTKKKPAAPKRTQPDAVPLKQVRAEFDGYGTGLDLAPSARPVCGLCSHCGLVVLSLSLWVGCAVTGGCCALALWVGCALTVGWLCSHCRLAVLSL
jgi:hypothetical protein